MCFEWNVHGDGTCSVKMLSMGKKYATSEQRTQWFLWSMVGIKDWTENEGFINDVVITVLVTTLPVVLECRNNAIRTLRDKYLEKEE